MRLVCFSGMCLGQTKTKYEFPQKNKIYLSISYVFLFLFECEYNNFIMNFINDQADTYK